MEWPGVFVSSTCYDLIDLRSELEPFLRDLGFAPVLSDSPSSEFEIGNRDSIATCLENVRKCPVFICVLSQRYGPKLGKVGFEDVSATHLEYRTARDAKRAIHFYVRDRLLGEYEIWRKNRSKADLKFPWIQNMADYGLFELIEEHDKLVKDAGMSNYRWPFRSSVELKTRIAFDLRAQARTHRLRKMLESGTAPSVSPWPAGLSSNVGRLTVVHNWRNVGNETAHAVEIREGDGNWGKLGDLSPGEFKSHSFSRQDSNPFETKIVVRYSTLAGDMLEQEYLYLFDNPANASIRHIARRLLDARAFEIEAEIPDATAPPAAGPAPAA